MEAWTAASVFYGLPVPANFTSCNSSKTDLATVRAGEAVPSHTCVGVQEKRAPAEFLKFAVFVSWGNVAAGQKNHECDCTDSNAAGTVATERMLYG
jgi:hypothetical protein